MVFRAKRGLKKGLKGALGYLGKPPMYKGGEFAPTIGKVLGGLKSLGEKVPLFKSALMEHEYKPKIEIAKKPIGYIGC